jgi:hypothetical protein
MRAESLPRALLQGLAAGAAGTTALNAVTYLDMAIRGRPASTTPDRTVERLAARVGVNIPGEGDERSNRVSGLGAFGGACTGLAVGAALSAARFVSKPRSALATGLIGTTGALLVANGPMIAAGITDPRDWSAADWIADLVPHLAFGLVAGWVLDRLDRPEHRRT